MTQDSHDELVKALARRYNAGADAYAEHWQRMLAPMSAPLLDLLPLAEAARVLDLGCGPGTLAPALRRRAKPSWIAGVDRSMGMLRRTPALPRTAWFQMDGRRLAFPAHSFDAAVLAFSLFHYPDLTGGLAEVRRVLRPGGWAGTVTFRSSPDFEARRVWAEALAEVAPPDGSPVADLSAVDRTGATDRPEKVKALLEEAGFGNVTTHEMRHVHQWKPQEYLAVCSNIGSRGEAFRALDARARQRLLTRMRKRFERLPPGAFRFKPTVLYAVGRHPG